MRIQTFCVPAIILAFLSGCSPATSEKPLSKPGTSKDGERLEGVWLARREEGDTGKSYLHFIGQKEGLLKILSVIHSKDPGDDSTRTYYDAFATKIGERVFLNIRCRSRDQTADETLSINGYIFAFYETTGQGKLAIRVAKADGFVKAIDTNKLQGHVTRNGDAITSVKLTDTSENISAYLEKSNLDDDFGRPVELKKLIEPTFDNK